MRRALFVWGLIPLLILMISGCSYVGKRESKSVSVAPTNDRLLSATDVTTYLTAMGFTVEVKSESKAAATPFGTADSMLAVADAKEISVAVFPSPTDAANGLEQGWARARWAKPTTWILWRNVVVVVAKSDDSTGANLIEAFSRVADRTVTR